VHAEALSVNNKKEKVAEDCKESERFRQGTPSEASGIGNRVTGEGE